MEIFSQCAPVTDYNNWPKDIENKSIFPYLARHASINPTQYAEFCDFVEDWYQTSCAVVHYFPGGSEVIGSGSLIGGNCVSTARHNFNDVPTSHIFVRFFKYSIFSHKGKMFAQEESLDIPVIDTCCAINGLDAGYLVLPFLESSTFNKYAKVLPIQQSAFGGNLSPGEYGMFHFADGMHQISTGNMHDCVMGSWLHNDISIQAGPGSSGATVIGKWFDRTEGCGTSIYRKIGNEWRTSVERRLISFSHFTNSGATLDSISAPYLYDPHFLPSAASFSESGYEYLKWFWQEYAGQGGKHPSPAMYNVQDDHSNHHIIPQGDLFYLWHYVSDTLTYQPVNDKLKCAILMQVKTELLNPKKPSKELVNCMQTSLIYTLVCKTNLRNYLRFRTKISTKYKKQQKCFVGLGGICSKDLMLTIGQMILNHHLTRLILVRNINQRNLIRNYGNA